MTMPRIIVVIPARGGSKSIPRKNIIHLNGKPLIKHTVDYALKSMQVIDKLVVSTDDVEIASIALECGAEVPFTRPEEFSTDKSRDYAFMRHTLDYYDSINEIFDLFILLRPTSPFRPDGLIENVISIFEKYPDTNSVRCVTPVKEHPFRMWVPNQGNLIKGLISAPLESYNIPRQELPLIYFQTGDIEAMTRETLLSGSVSGEIIRSFVISQSEVLDIDTPDDLIKASKFQ